MCDVNYSIDHEEGEIRNYRRELDLEKGVASTSFVHNGAQYRMRCLISEKEDLMAAEFSTDREEGLTMSVLITRGRFYNCAGKAGEDSVYIDGDLGKGGSEFCIQARAVSEGGNVQVIGEHLVIQNVSRVIFYVNGVTTFPYRKKKVEDPYSYLKEQLASYTAEDFDRILAEHVKQHSKVFDRSVLKLKEDEVLSGLPTDQRLKRLREGKKDKGLAALYYGYGRYLLMASSRPGGLPANLQGIWCEKLEPTWDSKYTININTEMNYWPTERCNLGECAEPLIKFIEECAQTGEKTARVNYHCKGWCLHHNVDLWRKTTAVGPRNTGELNVQPWSFWLAGGGWLCRHLWDHYLFHDDIGFLEKTAYPLMKKCAQFYLDWMVEKDGMLVTCPSTAPENMFIDQGITTGISYGTAMDMEVIQELFQSCKSAMEKLKKEHDPFYKQLTEALNRLPKIAIGKYGQVQEWIEDFEENEVTHRHLSHLYGLYPSDDFTVDGLTPEMKKACETTLIRRGNDGVAWSRAWKIALWGRLGNSEKAGEEILRYLQLADSEDAKEISYTNGGIYENMFAARPLQIDGCLGFTAGIVEMLIQDEGKELKVLPALPKAWKKGYVKGLRLRNGEYINIEWDGENVKSSMYR